MLKSGIVQSLKNFEGYTMSREDSSQKEKPWRVEGAPEGLPFEIWGEIVSFSDAKRRKALRQVSKYFRTDYALFFSIPTAIPTIEKHFYAYWLVEKIREAKKYHSVPMRLRPDPGVDSYAHKKFTDFFALIPNTNQFSAEDKNKILQHPTKLEAPLHNDLCSLIVKNFISSTVFAIVSISGIVGTSTLIYAYATRLFSLFLGTACCVSEDGCVFDSCDRISCDTVNNDPAAVPWLASQDITWAQTQCQRFFASCHDKIHTFGDAKQISMDYSMDCSTSPYNDTKTAISFIVLATIGTLISIIGLIVVLCSYRFARETDKCNEMTQLAIDEFNAYLNEENNNTTPPPLQVITHLNNNSDGERESQPLLVSFIP